MKAIIEFDLPDDKEQFAKASSAMDLYHGVYLFDQWLRSQIKWNDSLSEEQQDTYEYIRQKLHEELGALNVSIT
jgi:hypothetical protein